jgi:hypothetical protein
VVRSSLETAKHRDEVTLAAERARAQLIIRLGCVPMEDFDRSFIRSVYDWCEGSLDRAVDGEEVGQALGLDEAQTADVVARLMRTGLVRDVAARYRIKITARGIAVARLEPPSTAAVSPPGSDVG